MRYYRLIVSKRNQPKLANILYKLEVPSPQYLAYRKVARSRQGLIELDVIGLMTRLERKGGRFWWTEEGWRTYGRRAYLRFLKLELPISVRTLDESSLKILYRDAIQVVASEKDQGTIRVR